MKTIKNILLILFTALACYGIFSIYQSWQRIKSVDTITSDVLLERVEKVFKLVTVEGNFNEIYNYENHVFADLWPFRKRAIAQVNARVAVGYDFESVDFVIDEEAKTITIKGDLIPEILSLEHDVKSYDFDNGLFNMINDQDIERMGFEAKEFIRIKAQESDLFLQSEEQKAELLEMLSWVLKAAGWTLEMDSTPLLH